MSVSWSETKETIARDVYRNLGTCNSKVVVKEMLRYGSTTGLLIYFRLCGYFAQKEKKTLLQKAVHAFCYLKFKKKQVICGIELNQHTKIGAGIRFPHRGAIIIHPMAVIGEDCEIMQDVTIGNNILKDRTAVAIIGDRVMICAGSKIIGGVAIGSDTIIGANSVVNRDMPEKSIIAGVPARVLGTSRDYYLINM